MYIANRPLSAGYKIFTALIAWVSLWFLVHDYQGSSVQFLATFVALLSGVYFIAAAFKVLFGHRHHPWRAFCPVWHGALLLGALLVLTTQAVASAFPAAAILTPTGVGGLIASLILPLLIIFDWALFSAKGHWRLIDPWYWLCLPLVYLAINYLVIGATVSSEPLVYPYGFLDYLTLGVIPTLIWIGGIMVGCLAIGFLLAGSDRAFRSREAAPSAKSTAKATISVPAETSAESTISVPTETPAEATTPAPVESSNKNSDQAATQAESSDQVSASPSNPTASDQSTDSDQAAPEEQPDAAAPAPRSKSARSSTRKLVDVRPSTKTRRPPTSRKTAKTAKTAAAKAAKNTADKTTKPTTKSASPKSPKSPKPTSTRPAASKRSQAASTTTASEPSSGTVESAADTTTDTKSTRSFHGRTQVGD